MDSSPTAQVLELTADGFQLIARGDKLQAAFNAFGGERRVHIITLCGPARHGLSFLANILLRCMTAKAAGNEDVFGFSEVNNSDPSQLPQRVEGFPWGHGDTPITHGIWMTNRPITVLDGRGDEVDVYLVDTRSICDEFTSAEETQRVLQLCLQISSTLIFSVPRELSEEKLTALATAYEEVTSDGHTSVCKHLYVVVRDASPNSKYAFGETGGRLYLANRLKLQDGMSHHATRVRDVLKRYVERGDCIMLPSPGDHISKPDYDGNLGLLAPKFTNGVEELVPSLLSSETLKCGRGGSGALAVLQSLLPKQHDSNQAWIPAAGSAGSTTPASTSTHSPKPEEAEQLLRTKVVECLNDYCHTMEAALQAAKHEFLDIDDFQSLSEKTMNTALDKLTTSEIQTTMKKASEYKSLLATHLNQHHGELKTINMKRRETKHLKWNEAMTTCISLYEPQIQERFEGDGKILISSINFDNARITMEVKKHFMSLVDADGELLAEHLHKLDCKFQEVFDAEKHKYEERRMQWLATKFEQCKIDANDLYGIKMKKLMTTENSTGTWNEEELLLFHNKTRSLVLANAMTELPCDDEKFTQQLKQFLDGKFVDIQAQNMSNREALLAAKDQFIQPAIDQQRKQVQELIVRNGQTVQGFNQACVQLKTKVIADFRKNIFIRDDTVVQQLLRELEIKLDDVHAAGLQQFSDLLKSTQEMTSALLASGVERYGKKMDGRAQSKRMPNDSDIEHFHGASVQEVVIELHEECIQKGVEVDRETVDVFRTELDSRLPVLKQKAKELREERLEEAEVLMKMGVTAYRKGANSLKMSWRSEAEAKAFHDAKAATVIREFQGAWVVKDEIYVAPAVDNLLAKLLQIFDRELEELRIRIEKYEVAIGKKTLDGTKLYESEMKKHFARHAFVKPADLRLRHEEITTLVLKKFGTDLPDHGLEQLREALFPLYEKANEKNTMNTPGDKPAIGIDLGTTHSCVGIYHKGGKGEVVIVDSGLGTKTVPSYVAITPVGEVIGEAAKQQAHIYPADTIFDAKRLIGRDFHDTCVQSDIKLWPFKVEQKQGTTKPVIIANNQPYYPEQIASKLLNHLKGLAEKYLNGKAVNKAVITVPAYFNDGQRQATKDAAELVGLEVLQIINEPTAAAIAYYLHQAGAGDGNKPSNILVYDLGGGTFDVSVLTITGGQIQVQATGGDTHLGGEDFDSALVQHCVDAFQKTTGVNLRAGMQAANQLRRLRNECEVQKKILSAAHHATIVVEGIVSRRNLSVSVTREEFEKMNVELFKKTINIVNQALTASNLSKAEIDQIVMVGGSSRIPCVQAMLKTYFNGKQLCESLNADEAVAYGAAILAAKLNGIEEQKLQKMSLHDVTPLSIGIEVIDNLMELKPLSVIIPRNTRLPHEETRTNYSTSRHNQTEVVISIYEGEEKSEAKKNHLLGKFTLSNIPPNLAGKEDIHVTMKVDKEGILSVVASCPKSGSTNQIEIKADKGLLTTEEKRRLRLGDA